MDAGLGFGWGLHQFEASWPFRLDTGYGLWFFEPLFAGFSLRAFCAYRLELYRWRFLGQAIKLEALCLLRPFCIFSFCSSSFESFLAFFIISSPGTVLISSVFISLSLCLKPAVSLYFFHSLSPLLTVSSIIIFAYNLFFFSEKAYRLENDENRMLLAM